MDMRFKTRSGITVARREVELDYRAGIGDLIDRLDTERGVFLSSGIEFPDRYSRWDMGVVNPPLELTARGHDVTVRALNEKGGKWLTILAPVLAGGDDTKVAAQSERRLDLKIEISERVFAEEERSLRRDLSTALCRAPQPLNHRLRRAGGFAFHGRERGG